MLYLIYAFKCKGKLIKLQMVLFYSLIPNYTSMHETTQRILTAIPLTVITVAIVVFAPKVLFIPVIAGMLMYMLTYEWPHLMPASTPYFGLITTFYPIIPLLLILIMHFQTGPITTTYLLSMVALQDSVSYFIGKAFGKTKLFSISPGKSLEGFLGGLYATIFLNSIFLLKEFHQFIFIVLFSILLCSVSFAGDIFESYLKRRAGLKDVGNALPGHGGIFDRVDGLLFAIFLIYPIQYKLQALLITKGNLFALL